MQQLPALWPDQAPCLTAVYIKYIQLYCKFHSTARCIDQHQHQLKMCQQASCTPNTAFFPVFRVQYNSWLRLSRYTGSDRLLCPENEGIYLPKECFHMVNFMSPWWAGLETKKIWKFQQSPGQTEHIAHYWQCCTSEKFYLSWILIIIVSPVTGPLYHQWSMLVCNATNNNDLHFSIVKDLDLCMPPLQVHVTTWNLHVVACQSVHSTGTLLVSINVLHDVYFVSTGSVFFLVVRQPHSWDWSSPENTFAYAFDVI